MFSRTPKEQRLAESNSHEITFRTQTARGPELPCRLCLFRGYCSIRVLKLQNRAVNVPVKALGKPFLQRVIGHRRGIARHKAVRPDRVPVLVIGQVEDVELQLELIERAHLILVVAQPKVHYFTAADGVVIGVSKVALAQEVRPDVSLRSRPRDRTTRSCTDFQGCPRRSCRRYRPPFLPPCSWSRTLSG